MKKVLAAVVAAAMALSMSVSAFAATAESKYPAADRACAGQNGYTVDTEIKLVNDAGNLYEAGTTLISALNGPATITATESAEYTYTVTAYGNMYNTKEFAEAADWTTLDVFNINYHNFDEVVKVKGPVEVVDSRIDGDSFEYNYTGGTNLLAVRFDVTFELEATNEDSTDLKGVVVEYGVKPVSVPNRSGFKGKTEKTNEGDLAVGYTNEDLDDLYDTVVAAFDDMIDYEEDSFEVDMEGNPVIPSSVIRFLQKNLANNKSVIFFNDDDSVYFEGSKTLELTGAAMDEFSASNHANIKVNDNGVDEISDVLDEAGVDYKWFNYVVARDITGIHSFDSTYDDPYVYLVDAEGALTEIDLVDYDYGDVAFEGPMGQYIITEGAIPAELFVEEEPEEPIEDDDIIEEPVEDDDVLVDEDGNAIEDNPGTGSSNAISVAVAMAVVSLAAAGVVASKKASK